MEFVALRSLGSMGPWGWRSDRSLALSASFQLADFFAVSAPLIDGMALVIMRNGQWHGAIGAVHRIVGTIAA